MADDEPKKKSKKKTKGPTVAELQAELEDLDQENEELTNYVATLEQELVNAGECLRQADEDMTSLKREFTGVRKDLDSSQAQLAEAERKLGSNKEEVEGEKSKLRAGLESAKSDASLAKAENETLQKELNKYKSDVASLQVVVDGLKSDEAKNQEAKAKKKKDKKRASEALSDEAVGLKIQLVDVTAQKAALEKEVQALKETQTRHESASAAVASEKTEQTAQLKELQAKLDVANREAATLVRAKADEVERVRAAEKSSIEAREKAEAALRELNALKSRHEELERQFKQSQSALALAQAAAMEAISGTPAGQNVGLTPQNPSNLQKNPSVAAAERAARRSSRLSTNFNAELRQPTNTRINLITTAVGEDRSPTTQDRLISPRGLSRAYSKNEAAFNKSAVDSHHLSPNTPHSHENDAHHHSHTFRSTTSSTTTRTPTTYTRTSTNRNLYEDNVTLE